MARIEYSKMPDRLINEAVAADLSVVVCIPCYNESEADAAVDSILRCEVPDGHSVEVIVLINAGEDAPMTTLQHNESTHAAVAEIKVPEGYAVHPIYVHEIPKKKSGVGRARKLAMDEAALRLDESASSLKIIACYDADCSCDTNYIAALIEHYQVSQKEAVSIHFEHPEAQLGGDEIQHAIYLYELHLRYFIQYQQLIGLPFAYQTVGSSMACSLSGYRRVGGMNTRQAGEDFYFMHKFIKDDQCDRLSKTTVYPSARVSNRVPFGTGRAVGEMLASREPYKTYHPSSFKSIRCVVGSVDQLYDAKLTRSVSNVYEEQIKVFLQSISFDEKVDRIRANTTTLSRFRRAFYQFFDAFIFMKYLHHMRDHHYPDMDVLAAAEVLADKLRSNPQNSEDILHEYRTRAKIV